LGLQTKNVLAKVISIEGHSNLSIVIYDGNSIPRQDIEAKRLADIHCILEKDYSGRVKVLKCESAEFYCKKLFPSICKFEGNLRHLLYLLVAMSNDPEARNTIADLDQKDFGTIFDALFIDRDGFTKDLEALVNRRKDTAFGGKPGLSKIAVLQYVQAMDEHVLWDKLYTGSKDLTLRRRFEDVRTARNDVMHGHYIGKDFFDEAAELFSTVNDELEHEIDSIRTKTISLPEEFSSQFNLALSAFVDQATAQQIRDAIAASYIANSPGLIGSIKSLYGLGVSKSLVEQLAKANASLLSGLAGSSNTLEFFTPNINKLISEE